MIKTKIKLIIVVIIITIIHDVYLKNRRAAKRIAKIHDVKGKKYIVQYQKSEMLRKLKS